MWRILSLFLLFLPITSQAFQITLSDEQKAVIHEVVEAFGEQDDEAFMKSADVLLPKVIGLMEVSPLQVIGYVLTKEALKEIFLLATKHPFKWNLFIQGFQIKMEQEVMSGKLHLDLQSFVSHHGLDLDKMEHMIVQHAWAELVLYVLEHAK